MRLVFVLETNGRADADVGLRSQLKSSKEFLTFNGT